jgi:hypothetical protein
MEILLQNIMTKLSILEKKIDSLENKIVNLHFCNTCGFSVNKDFFINAITNNHLSCLEYYYSISSKNEDTNKVVIYFDNVMKYRNEINKCQDINIKKYIDENFEIKYIIKLNQ